MDSEHAMTTAAGRSQHARPVSGVRSVALRTLGIIAGYGMYAWLVALLPTSRAETPINAPPTQVTEGRRVWLASGCQSCHSIYGLGGHSGPDLTNVVTRASPATVGALVRTGSRGMPAFSLDDAALEAIVTYLAAIDASGTYPPSSLTDRSLGKP